jgi:hypothetical protein
MVEDLAEAGSRICHFLRHMLAHADAVAHAMTFQLPT